MAHLTISGATAPQATAAVGPDHALRLTLSHITLVVTLSPEDTHALAHQLAAALGLALVPPPAPAVPCSWCTHEARAHDAAGACTICGWCMRYRTDRSPTQVPPPAPTPTPAQVALDGSRVLSDEDAPHAAQDAPRIDEDGQDASGARGGNLEAARDQNRLSTRERMCDCGHALFWHRHTDDTALHPCTALGCVCTGWFAEEEALPDGAHKPPSTGKKTSMATGGDVADGGDSESKIDASLAVTGPIPSGIALCVCGEPVAQHATRTDGITGPCLQASCTCQRFTLAAPPQRDTGLHGPLTFAEHMTLTPEEDAIAQRMGLRAPVPAVPAAVRFVPCASHHCRHLGSIHDADTGRCMLVSCDCARFTLNPAYGSEGIP
jgi:hypothetical protein